MKNHYFTNIIENLILINLKKYYEKYKTLRQNSLWLVYK